MAFFIYQKAASSQKKNKTQFQNIWFKAINFPTKNTAYPQTQYHTLKRKKKSGLFQTQWVRVFFTICRLGSDVEVEQVK